MVGAAKDVIAFSIQNEFTYDAYLPSITLINAVWGFIPYYLYHYFKPRLSKGLSVLTTIIVTQSTLSILAMSYLIHWSFAAPLVNLLTSRLIVQAISVPLYSIIVYIFINYRDKKEAIAKAKDDYQAITNLTGDIIVRVDNEGRWTFLNDQACTFWGESREKLLGQHFLNYLHPDDQEETYAVISKTVKSNSIAKGLINRQKTPHGWRIVQWNGSPLHHGEEYLGFQTTGRDITEQRQAETALAQSHENMTTVLENTLFGVAIIDRKREIRWVNPVVCKLAGFDDPQELIGKQCGEYLCPAGQQECPILDHGQAVDNSECILRRSDGQIIPILKSVTEITLEGEEVLLETFIDISKLKKTQQELSLQKERLANIVEGANVGTWEWNVQTGETIFNEKWAELIGYTSDEISPISIDTWIRYTHPADLEQSNRELVKHFNGEVAYYDVECRMKHKDGHWIWINDRGKVISWSEDGKPLWVFGTHIDISARKKTEEALKLQARERAAVDTFTYSVSNDLQAPLRRIEGFSEALLEECPEQLNDQGRDYLNRIVTQVSSMKALTDALLQLSKVVTHEIDSETVDLSALARAHLEKLQLSEPTRRVEKIVAPNLTLEADVDLTSLIVVNLLDNAWKFTSRVEEALIEFGSAEQNGRTVYYLKDNGAGFDMNHAAKLFTPFNKLHSVEDYPGIGFGLNLVYRIIARHGGEIWAEGEVGKGACFYFTL